MAKQKVIARVSRKKWKRNRLTTPHPPLFQHFEVRDSQNPSRRKFQKSILVPVTATSPLEVHVGPKFPDPLAGHRWQLSGTQIDEVVAAGN
jgi:hypothetical protein